MASDLISSAVSLMQIDPDLGMWRAVFSAFRESNAEGGATALNDALSAILTAAGIAPAKLGPDMVDQLIEWERAQKIAVFVAPMQAASAALAVEAAQLTTATPDTPVKP